MIDLSPPRADLAGLATPDDGSDRVARCSLRLPAGTDRRALAFRVPGRVELFGKHTDYAGGRSLLCCTDRSFVLVAVPRADGRVRLTNVETGEVVDLEVSATLAAEPGTWTDYPRTVIRRIEANFAGAFPGADIAFLSDIPQAAGLSSSSAFVTGLALVLLSIGDIARQPRFRSSVPTSEALAEYVAAIETGTDWADLPGARGVGTEGGSQDHTAILCGRADHVVRYSFAPVAFEGLARMPADWAIAVGASGVRAEKTAGALEKYNRLSRLAGEAAARWRTAYGGGARHLGEILGHSADPGELTDGFRSLCADSEPAVFARARQFVEESAALVPAALEAFARADAEALGRFAARSHHLADRDLGNQTPETNALVELAREHGAFAASAFGAGFGGSVWAAVPRAEAQAFTARWREAYAAAFPSLAAGSTFFVGGAAPPARRLV